MIRVAFLNTGSKEWIAQVNYLKNLLFALASLPDREIQPVLFFGLKADPEIVATLAPFAEIVRTPLLDQGSLLRNLYRLGYKLTGRHTLLNWYLKSRGISVLFHSNIHDANTPFKIINWIPDFQYLHLPGMFPQAELAKRRLLDKEIIGNSDAVVLSSHDALKDYRFFAPAETQKAQVLQFVAQPSCGAGTDCTLEQLASRYGFSGKYFYLPNQFWKHKNHLVVFQAVQQLRDRGEGEMLLLCSGHLRDDRNRDHMESLTAFVREHALERNIRFLGLIPYGDVVSLMRNAVSVINPSLFEGWSSTVEEAKSIGKNLILSDIGVHREQAPPGALYFDPADPGALAQIMADNWLTHPGGPDAELERAARESLAARTLSFANRFRDIVLTVTKAP